MAILEGLNPSQKEAVLAKNGPLLIMAGAGSGKTKTIAHRIAYLISEGVNPESILAVTFTNKAAEEMRERIAKLLAQEKLRQFHDTRMPFIGTFHSLGVFILRAYGRAIGVPKNFTILDEEDSRQVIRDLVREFELDPDVYPPQRVRAQISRFKNELVTSTEFAREAEESPYQKNIERTFSAYEERLREMKALDFDDLLIKSVELFEKSAEAREFYEQHWEYIHIDEYQDTNRAQYVLTRFLAGKHKNITVVGDVDQAIYSWRGADWRNILQFETDWPDAKVILLEENYRSTKVILEAANAVIRHNKERKEKNLWSAKEAGGPIELVVASDERQEAFFVAEYIKYLASSGVGLGEITILFRTNAQSRAIEEAFLKKNIPYRLYAGVRFYERKEIKDVLGYLRYALNPDDMLSEKRILNAPPRGIGKVTMLKYLSRGELKPPEKEKIKKFKAIMEKVRESVQTKKATGALKAVLRDAGFDAYYKGNKLEEDRRENINELLPVVAKFDALAPLEGIQRLLEEASLMTRDTEVDPEGAYVTLLTAHGAKGLEFDIVIIVGMEEGLFPHTLSETEADIEEERRLFYVALTRARKKILITLARRRMLYGEVSFNDPSRFIKEIPEHLLSGPHIESVVKNEEENDDDEISIF